MGCFFFFSFLTSELWVWEIRWEHQSRIHTYARSGLWTTGFWIFFFSCCCAAKLQRNLGTWIVTAWTDSVRYLAHSASVALPGYGAAGRFSFFLASSFTTTWAPCWTVRPPAPARPWRSTAISPTTANSSRCCPSRAAGVPGTVPGASRTFSRTSPPCKCRYLSRSKQLETSSRPSCVRCVLVWKTHSKLPVIVQNRDNPSWNIYIIRDSDVCNEKGIFSWS